MATAVEGKLTIWIKGGKFEYNDDLYIQVCLDDRKMFKTKESDSHKPSWDEKISKHVKGEYTSIVLKLMDEDTFSSDDLLGTCKIPFDAIVASKAFTKTDKVELDGEIEMFSAAEGDETNSIGHVRVGITFSPGDVNMFQMMADRF